MPALPTPRLVFLAAIATALAVVAGYAPSARAPLFALDAVILLAAAVDLAAIAGRRIEVEREIAAIFSVGRRNPVTLHIRSRGRRTLRATVGDDPIGDADVHGLPLEVALRPRATVTVRYELVPTRRGARHFGAVTVRYPGPLGLVARNERLAADADVDVYPDVHAARALELLRRQGRQDARLGSMRVRGGDTEFERLRPYARGDEPRHVDWRATARRDELTVRQFQAESNQNVVFLLDIGRGMRGQAARAEEHAAKAAAGDGVIGENAPLGSIDNAMNAALLAADVALRAGDKAGLLVFDDAPRTWLPPIGGRAGARKITRAVYALDAGLGATDYRAAIGFLRTQIKARSLVILLTNVLEHRGSRELAGAVRSLMPRHLPLCVFMRDLDLEALVDAPASREDDLYVRAAAAEALGARQSLMRELKNAGVLVLDAKPQDVTPELVKGYLDVKARRLL
jgi:uncharacterized protein (DUF58 family)